MIAITFALPAESSGVVRSLRERKIENEIIFGKLGARDVAVFHTGVGREACERNLEKFLGTVQPKILISSGFAGGVDGDLRAGDVVAAENYSDRDLISLLERALYGSKMRKVRLFTATSVIDSAEERNRIGRGNGAAAVDMETEVIAGACAKQGIRMVSLRAISDTRENPFPIPPSILFDIKRQKTDSARLAWHMVTHPAAIPGLIRFYRQIVEARKALTGEIVPWVYALGHPDPAHLSGRV